MNEIISEPRNRNRAKNIRKDINPKTILETEKWLNFTLTEDKSYIDKPIQIDKQLNKSIIYS